MTSLTYWKLSLNKFGETFLQKFRTKNVITQKFTFKRSPELVHQLENLFAHLFLQFQLVIIDFHGFIVILVTPPSDQTFGHSILINYDYNKSLFVLSCLWVYIPSQNANRSRHRFSVEFQARLKTGTELAPNRHLNSVAALKLAPIRRLFGAEKGCF